MTTTFKTALYCAALAGLAFTNSVLAADAVPADSMAAAAPITAGRYPVGCSDVTQDFSRIPAGVAVDNYWEGTPYDGQGHYVTDLLTAQNAVRVQVQVPDDGAFYPQFSRNKLDFLTIVCYPTDGANPRTDYPLPNGGKVPKMQTGSQTPIWPAGQEKYPLLVYSHGLSGSPLKVDYLNSISRLASHGYVVMAIFHGDDRFSKVKIENISDAIWVLRNYERVAEMMAIRALSVPASLDRLLGDPAYVARIDTNRIAGFGTSLGGETLMLTAGAKLTDSLRRSARPVVKEERIKAVAGLVPYSGQKFLPAFGEDNAGVEGVTVPYIGIAGTADTTAPISVTEGMVRRLYGPRYLISLEGIGHYFDTSYENDLYTWVLTFYNAYLNDDRAARAQLQRMQTVLGGVNDRVVVEVTPMAADTAKETRFAEFYSDANRHYWLSPMGEVQTMLMAPNSPWHLTGWGFKLWKDTTTGLPQVCQFQGDPSLAPGSRFFTAKTEECSALKGGVGWTFEGISGVAPLPRTGAMLTYNDGGFIISGEAGCPQATIPVFRAYNGRYREHDSNHRFTVNRDAYRDLVNQGWVGEGVAFCSAP